MKSYEVDKAKVTPMMKQYLAIKEQYPDVILFFRLGDFYEMFFEDASLCAKELEIALTGKSAGLDEKIPMCGVPHHAADSYINKLVKKGYKVGICEQTSDPKESKGLVERDIVKIVSQGTLIDEKNLDEKSNNYIAAISDLKDSYIITYADISTGDVYLLKTEHNYLKLANELLNINAREVIVSKKISSEIINIIKNNFKISVTTFENKEPNKKYDHILKTLKDDRLKSSVYFLINYIVDTQKRDLAHFKEVIIKDKENYLYMDYYSKNNLELTETIRNKDRMYSLLWLLDKTKTAMGSRLLKRWIENPITNKKELNERYNTITTLLNEFLLKDELKDLLGEVYDLERLTGKIAYGSAGGRDLLQLLRSIKILPDLKTLLRKLNFEHDFPLLKTLKKLLEESLYENPPLGLKEGYLIKEGYNKELDELKELRHGGKKFIAKFEADERIRTGISKLKVGFNRVFGYYIEVTKGSSALVKEEFGYVRKQTLANSERFITPILKEKEDLILGAEEKIFALEYNLFLDVKEQTAAYIKDFQKIVAVISKIDVLAALANVAENNNYVKPELIDTKEMIIKNNRHPVVEKVNSFEFVENDILFDDKTNILLITGPNMAGKSTYMRQIAITVIMAQIGSFVPAESAKMPVFDKIFTRIGASDDLVSGDSTFMVEMKEAANAILNATENSLILFDELGRGTATYDGMSLARAIIEYIHEKVHCKTLFSTHYHELTTLSDQLEGIKNIHVSTSEENGTLTFLHKIKDGAVDKSYGIHVAQLAKLPKALIKRATAILSSYENGKKSQDIKQLKLDFEEPKIKVNEVEEEVKAINLDNLTPIEAMNLLYKLKDLTNKE